MPRKRLNRSPVDKSSEDFEDDDFLFDDSQSSSGRSTHEPIHRNAANARERARMRVLSKAFCRLKTTLPWVPADTKLSKLDTLRLAASYIAHLRALLHEPRSAHTPPHPLSLAWPFAFQHGGSLGCGVSQRWNTTHTDASRAPQNQRTDINDSHSQEYTEHDYHERNYDDAANDAHAQIQYNYGYKENYYEMRNSYVSDGLVNNV